jgi:glycine/D-amino acid oxidase-like deaminating enzyme
VQRATIVGAGVFGSWIAHALKARGWKITLVEQHGPANSRASSGGETRIIRASYGAQAVYSQWARESLPAWLELEEQVDQRLFVKTGALFLGGEGTWLADTAATLSANAVSSEWITPDDLGRRFPQLQDPGSGDALFEPDAGVLFARRAVQSLVDRLVADGVRLVRARAEPHTLIEEIDDDVIILAAGAWLPSLLPDLLGEVIAPTRQEVFFFGTPPGDSRFGPEQMPAWVAFNDGIYGLPDLEHRGVKVAFDAHGRPADPETMNRSVDASSIARVREVLQRHLPALADAPLLETRVCQYENTADGHLLLDQLPGHERVWIAGGGSGHGFKHGPAIGRYMADVIESRRAPVPAFQLAGRPPRQRAVY